MSNSRRNIFNRRYVIKVAIMKILESLFDNDINGIEKLYEQLKYVCDAGIIKSKTLKKIQVALREKPNTNGNKRILSMLIFEIDWERYELHVKNGDEEIYVERRLEGSKTSLSDEDDLDLSLAAISEALNEVRNHIKSTSSFLEWDSCSYILSWNGAVDLEIRKEISDKIGLVKVEEPDLKETASFYHELGINPSKISELKVRFLTDKPKNTEEKITDGKKKVVKSDDIKISYTFGSMAIFDKTRK